MAPLIHYYRKLPKREEVDVLEIWPSRTMEASNSRELAFLSIGVEV